MNFRLLEVIESKEYMLKEIKYKQKSSKKQKTLNYSDKIILALHEIFGFVSFFFLYFGTPVGMVKHKNSFKNYCSISSN